MKKEISFLFVKKIMGSGNCQVVNVIEARYPQEDLQERNKVREMELKTTWVAK